MAGRISETVIQQILDRVNLVELIGQEVKLRRTGQNWTGLCPFHSDGKPSFSVNPDRGFYYCFGCHEGGNAVSYLMKGRGLRYVDAIELLSRTVGIELEFEEGDRKAFDRARERRRQLFDVNLEAQGYFRSQLFTPTGRRALAYLEGRGISREMLSRFQVGFCPSGHTLYDRLVARGAPLNLASDLGMIVKSRRTNQYVDRLGSRVIFPVLTVGEDVAGFSGRTLPDGPDPKYLNSPDSDVFKKGELLFGLVPAREQMKKRDACILVEGQLDVIALHQAGIENAVAPLGTAVTEHQAAIIRRFTKNVIIMFDGDPAGRKAAWRAMTILMKQGLYGQVVRMPDDEDPDSVLQSEGAEALKSLIDGARPFLEHAVETLTGKAGGDLHGRTLAAKEGMAFAREVGDPIDRQLFLERLAGELGLSPEALKVEAVSRPSAAPEKVVAIQPQVAGDFPPRERELVAYVFRKPELVRLVCQDEAFDLIETEQVKKFFLQLLDEFEEFGRVDPHDFVARLQNPGLKDICGELLLQADAIPDITVEKAVEQMLGAMNRSGIRARQLAARREVKRAEARGDLDEAIAMSEQVDALERELAKLARAQN
jgi:DNA primase